MVQSHMNHAYVACIYQQTEVGYLIVSFVMP